jgi:serine/threonine protein kinase
MIEEIKEIEKYAETPKQTPIQACEKLLACVNPKLRFIELTGIGGEGILLRANDETSKQIVVKVARSDYSGKYAQTPQQASIVNKFSFKGKSKPTNTNYSRFLEGAILQRDLYSQIFEDNVTYFSIPQVYTISQDPLYFIMPYLENIGILRYFKDFSKKLKDILAAFVYLLRAMEYLHGKGIIHRDLKADNIMIGNKFKSIVILDWTLSKQIGDRGLTVIGTEAGTPGLAPIKYMTGSFKDANFLDDIYILGYVLWEFVTGKRVVAFWKQHDGEKLKASKIEDFKRLLIKYLPPCLEQIFWKATEIEEKKRYQNVQEFYDEIIKVLAESELLLQQNTLVTDVKSKQIDEAVDVIFDTSVTQDLCKNCTAASICKDFELCNLLLRLGK